MITFEHINIEGFGSFQTPFFYPLNRSGINVIQGKNGSGKTTIFSALTWCLYGQTLKGKSNVEPWEDIRGPKFKGTFVQVEFRVGKEIYRLSRTKNYKVAGTSKSQLILYREKQELNQFRNKDDVQAEVVRLLGMSFNLFKNSISFGQNLTRLLQESGPEQKKIFDEAFEMMFINKAREKAVKIQADQEDQYLRLKTEHDLLTEKLNNYENQIKGKEETQKERQGNILHLIREIRDNRIKEDSARVGQKNVEGFRVKRESYKGKVERLKKIEDEEFKLDFGLTQLVAVIKESKQKLNDIVTNLSKPIPQCITCGQEIRMKSRDDYRKQQKGKVGELKESILKDQRLEQRINIRLVELRASKSKLLKFRDKLKRVEILLDRSKNSTLPPHEYKATRLELRQRLKEVKARLSADLELLKDLNFKRNKLIERELFLLPNLQGLEKKVKLHKWLINDPLSNKGLKAFIFNSMLGLINKRLRYYGRYLGYVIEFHIDMDSGNKNFKATVQANDKERPYNDLSGGQKQLVDICLAFSIHDVVTNTKKVNILLMDEIFESLDIDNVELVSELISVKSEGISTHLISHQQSLNFSRVANTLQLEIHKGITRVV